MAPAQSQRARGPHAPPGRRSAPGTVRFGRDTDGTVSVSDHERAACYLPTGLIPDHRDRHLPGCRAPYATLGDSPCDPAD